MKTYKITAPFNANIGDVLLITDAGRPVVLNQHAYDELFGQQRPALPAPEENSSTKFVEEIRHGNSSTKFVEEIRRENLPVVFNSGDTIRNKILKTLAKFPGSSVQEIAERGNINRASVYVLLAKLRAKKYIRSRRRQANSGYTVKGWYLTSEARQAVTTFH